jgi:hypothetical protein
VGLQPFLPANTISAHVTRMGNRPPKFACDVALSGAFGVDRDVSKMSSEEHQTIKNAVALYKSTLRDIVLNGDLYRLDSPYEKPRAALNYVTADQSKAALFVYQLKDGDAEPVKTRGLDPKRQYWVKERNVANPSDVADDKSISGERSCATASRHPAARSSTVPSSKSPKRSSPHAVPSRSPHHLDRARQRRQREGLRRDWRWQDARHRRDPEAIDAAVATAGQGHVSEGHLPRPARSCSRATSRSTSKTAPKSAAPTTSRSTKNLDPFKDGLGAEVGTAFVTIIDAKNSPSKAKALQRQRPSPSPKRNRSKVKAGAFGRCSFASCVRKNFTVRDVTFRDSASWTPTISMRWRQDRERENRQPRRPAQRRHQHRRLPEFFHRQLRTSTAAMMRLS